MQKIRIFFLNIFNKYSGYFKEGAWVILGQILSFLASLYGVKILTRKMLPEEYGILSLSLTYVALLSQVLFAPLSAGSTRFYIIAKEKNELKKYARTLKYFLTIFSAISLVVTLIIGIVLVFISKSNLICILAYTFIFSITSGINLIFTSIQIAARQRSLVAIIQGVDSWSRYLIAIFLIIIFGAFTTSVISGYVASSILILFIQFYYLKNIISFNGVARDKIWEKKIWEYIWPFISWGLFTWAQISSDKWSLAIFSTPKNVGLYTALYQIGYFPISVITGFGIQLLTPIFFQRAGDGVDLEKVKVVNIMASKINVIGLIITCITFLFSLLFHSQIFNIFFHNHDYLQVSYLLPWLILSGGIFACAQALSLEMMSKMQTSNLAIIKIATALIGIVMNIIFAYFFEIRGVVFSSLIFSILFFFWIKYKIKSKSF